MASITNLRAISEGFPVAWLIRYLESLGLAAQDVALSMDLDAALLEEKNAALPVETYLRILEWAAIELSNPTLGIDIALDVPGQEFGLFGHLVRNGQSLRDSFRFLEIYHRILSMDFAFTFEESDGVGRCLYRGAPTTGQGANIDIDFGLAIVVKALRDHASPDWFPLTCCFVYPAPPWIDKLQAFFGDDVHFDQARNSIDYQASLLEERNEDADPSLLDILLVQANKLLDQAPAQADIVHELSLLITASLGYRPVTAVTAAEKFNMSTRQLHRLLAERGTSFRKIRELILLNVAKEALMESRISVTALAQELGYSETSAFNRMFKKTVGMSPGSYRRTHALVR